MASKGQVVHRYREGQDLRIVADLSGKAGEFIGLECTVKEQLPAVGGWPQYKVLIFGIGEIRGGIFEVDERELGAREAT